MESPLFSGKTAIRARALCIGERIDLRAFEATERLASAPLTVAAGAHGCAVLFRYGVVVLLDMGSLEEVAFLRNLEPLVGDRFQAPETEEAEIAPSSHEQEGVVGGMIHLKESSVERIQLLAEILAKSVMLSHYETSVAQVFERIEPMARRLQEGRGWRRGADLTRYIGGTLMIQQKMVGRVEILEKPELLWERPELERLHARLEDEYELRERHLALERKLDLVSHTAQTLLDMLQNTRSLRVEWYIVVLILLEIGLSLYDLFFRA